MIETPKITPHELAHTLVRQYLQLDRLTIAHIRSDEKITKEVENMSAEEYTILGQEIAKLLMWSIFSDMD